MSRKLAGFLATLPHVKVAAPVITDFNMSSAVEILYGIDYKTYNALKAVCVPVRRAIQTPDDVIIDDIFARSGKGYRVGDKMTIKNHTFRVCGIVENGKGGRRMVPIDTLGNLIGSDGKASVIYLKADNPANDNLIMQEIHDTKGLAIYRV